MIKMKTLAIHIKAAFTQLLMLAVVLLHSGCDENVNLELESSDKGTFTLSLTQGNVASEIITRTALPLDTDDFSVYLSENDGTPLIEGKKFSDLTETECTLPAGTGYQIKVESCTPDESVTLNDGWGMAHFVASTTFDIVSNQHTAVSLTCAMDNVGLQVVFDESFLEKFPTHAATTQDSRTRIFNQATLEQTAFFPVKGAVLNMRLRLTGSAGGWEDRLDVMKELSLSKGKIYTVNITYSNASSKNVAMRVFEVN